MSTRPGNQNRGWNDPPEFLHNNDTVNLVTNERNILNKRVSHTYDSSKPGGLDSVPTTQSTLSMPPSSAPPVTSNESAQNKVIDEVEEDLKIEDIEAIIKNKLDYLKETSVSVKIIDDILKRVKIFITNWEKLSKTVKSKMSELAKALKSEDLGKADDIHVRLMLDFSSEVIQWMVGIKKLIYELKNVQK